MGDTSRRHGDFAGDKRLAAPLALVVEEDAVHAVHAVALAVVFHNPEGIELGHGVGAARIEGSALALGHLLHLAEELAGAGLVDLGRLFAASDAHGFDQPQGAHGVGLGGVFRHLVERHLHMALCRQVVDFIGLHGGDDANEAARVAHVAVMQVDESAAAHVAHPLVEV